MSMFDKIMGPIFGGQAAAAKPAAPAAPGGYNPVDNVTGGQYGTYGASPPIVGQQAPAPEQGGGRSFGERLLQGILTQGLGGVPPAKPTAAAVAPAAPAPPGGVLVRDILKQIMGGG